MNESRLVVFDIDDVLNDLIKTTLDIVGGVPEKYELKKGITLNSVGRF